MPPTPQWEEFFASRVIAVISGSEKAEVAESQLAAH
jgi:hypothetical protein